MSHCILYNYIYHYLLYMLFIKKTFNLYVTLCQNRVLCAITTIYRLLCTITTIYRLLCTVTTIYRPMCTDTTIYRPICTVTTIYRLLSTVTTIYHLMCFITTIYQLLCTVTTILFRLFPFKLILGYPFFVCLTITQINFSARMITELHSAKAKAMAIKTT